MINLIKANWAKIIRLISLVCLSIILVIIADKLIWGNLFFIDNWPSFSMLSMVRSVLIFLLLLGIFRYITKKRRVILDFNDTQGKRFKVISIISMLLIAASILVVFMVDPATFNALSKEDSIVEWASAGALFGGFLVSFGALLTQTKQLTKPDAITLTLGLLTLCFFVLSMEEISWFQRVVNIDTPELFTGNQQQELNFHNFATDYLENIFYFGTFVFLVVLPFLRAVFKDELTSQYLNLFIPRPYICLLGTIACAYNFDMWNIVFTQITFFTSLIVLSVLLYDTKKAQERMLIFLSLLLLVGSQLIYLSFGERFDRLWEITEYKELLIAIPLFIYSCDIAMQLRKKT